MISAEVLVVEFPRDGGGESKRCIERLRCTPSCAFFECDGARCGRRGVVSNVGEVGEVSVLLERLCCVSTAGLK
jgi:hypothetical protein